MTRTSTRARCPFVSVPSSEPEVIQRDAILRQHGDKNFSQIFHRRHRRQFIRARLRRQSKRSLLRTQILTCGKSFLGMQLNKVDSKTHALKERAAGKLWSYRRFMKMTSLIPMLPVKSMPASVEFYQKLGFTVERRQDDWGWAMLRFDECRLMVDQSISAHPVAPRQGVIYLYPENVVEFHRQARANGVQVPDMDVTFYGMTEFRIEDPDGNQLWIGQTKSDGA